MKGRKPKPSSLRMIQGNPGGRPMPTNEPEVEVSTPKAPKTLSKAAAKHWDEVCQKLADCRVMTDLDVDALAIYCEAWARYQQATHKLATEGMVIAAPSGYPVQSPYLSIANKCIQQMQKMLTEFGMTPSSRTRVAAIPEKAHDAFEEYLARNKLHEFSEN